MLTEQAGAAAAPVVTWSAPGGSGIGEESGGKEEAAGEGEGRRKQLQQQERQGVISGEGWGGEVGPTE